MKRRIAALMWVVKSIQGAVQALRLPTLLASAVSSAAK